MAFKSLFEIHFPRSFKQTPMGGHGRRHVQLIESSPGQSSASTRRGARKNTLTYDLKFWNVECRVSNVNAESEFGAPVFG
jgi:hypothetical protein